ncbi:MAG: hypothetical protein AB8G26_17045 [Ilumatobacter sp.]
MKRRAIAELPRWAQVAALALFVVNAAMLVWVASVLLAPASIATAAPADTLPDAPPITVSEFFPEENNLSDCIGLVERPGCGSEARGGWRQTAVFVALVSGLGVIVWRISRGVRANRSGTQPSDVS